MGEILDVYVGTYTETVYFTSGKILHAKGKGIHYLHFDAESGTLSPVSVAEGVRSPSYLVKSRSGKYLYCVNEVKEDDGAPGGTVSAFRVDPTGSLTFINKQRTDGWDPCYIETDAGGTCVYVSVYGGGAVCRYRIEENGGLAPYDQRFEHQGSSIHPTRQTKSYPHSAILSPDERFVYFPDLGMDEIVAYARDSRTGKLAPAVGAGAKTRPGSGPRHLVFHPDGRHAYVINELDCTMTLFEQDALTGRLTALQDIPTLLVPHAGDKTCADIHLSPDGRFVYGTTRAANKIICCRINRETGGMEAVAEYPTGGDVPRNFAIDPSGHFLLVANQNSDNIVIFSIDPQSGMLTKKLEYAQPSPVCVKIYPGGYR